MARPKRRGPARKSASRRVLIVCEGDATEKIYLESARSELHLPKENLRIYSAGGGGRDAAVDRAIEVVSGVGIGMAEDQFDEVWVVLDTEVVERSGVIEAVNRAHSQQFNVALSNPCFEVWLLLHARDEGKHLTAKEAKRRCRAELAIPGRSKQHCRFDDDRLTKTWKVAAKRAQATRRRVARDEKLAIKPGALVVLKKNPATNVDELIEMMHRIRPRQ